MCFCRDLVMLQERIVKNVSTRLFGDKQVITGRCCQGAPLVPCADVTTPLLRCVVFVWSSCLLRRTCCRSVGNFGALLAGVAPHCGGRAARDLCADESEVVLCCVVLCCGGLWALLLLLSSSPPPGIKRLFVLPQRCLSLPSPPPAPPHPTTTPPVLPHSPSPTHPPSFWGMKGCFYNIFF